MATGEQAVSLNMRARTERGRRRRRGVVTVLGVVLLAGCADKPKAPEVTTATDFGRSGGRYKIGKPYQIKGVWYYPAVDYGYSEVGVASWYGPGFDGQETANGEIYDMNDLTAAHRTLPLPSIVRVTNLANGRSIKLKVNDRGPYAQGRIIDVSRRAAQMLGFYQQGTTQVQIDIEAEESRQIAQALTGGGASTMVAARTAPTTAPMPTPTPTVMPTPVLASQPMPSPAVESPPMLPPEAIIAERTTAGFQPPAPLQASPYPPLPETASSEPLPADTAPLPPLGVEPLVVQPLVVQPLAPTVSSLPPVAPAPAIASGPPARMAMADPAPWRPRPIESSGIGPRAAPGSGGSTGHAFVQAGAFADAGNANQARARLTEIGPVVVSPLNIDGRQMYRVRIGPLPPGENAERIRLATARAGYPASRVVLE